MSGWCASTPAFGWRRNTASIRPATGRSTSPAIPACRLAIEVEGGVHNGGRHIRPDGFVRDMLKYNEAAAAGWLLIRVTPDELLSLKTLRLIIRVARREAN